MVTQQRPRAARSTRRRRPCRHHWLLAPQGGPTSKGKCKHCGAVRQFANAADDWVDDREGRYARG